MRAQIEASHIGLPIELNLYAYVEGNFVDALGLASTLVDCLKRCATNQFGITTLLGILAVLTGQPWIGTRGKLGGATPGTSIASKYLSKLFPQRLPVRLPSRGIR